jgi:hypothetical protein
LNIELQRVEQRTAALAGKRAASLAPRLLAILRRRTRHAQPFNLNRVIARSVGLAIAAGMSAPRVEALTAGEGGA